MNSIWKVRGSSLKQKHRNEDERCAWASGERELRKPAQPGLNKTKEFTDSCNRMSAGRQYGWIWMFWCYQSSFFPLVLLASLQRFCVPQWRLSQWWGSAGGRRYTLYLRFMISQEQLAEFEYAKLGKITQVLVYLVILEPNSETWGIMEYSDSPGLPGSWASGGGDHRSKPFWTPWNKFQTGNRVL